MNQICFLALVVCHGPLISAVTTHSERWYIFYSPGVPNLRDPQYNGCFQ